MCATLPDITGIQRNEQVKRVDIRICATLPDNHTSQVSASPSALFTEGGMKHDAALSQQRQEICRCKPMYIDFNSIGWDSWIIAPLGYQAYKCAGSCTVNQTNYHTIVQALAHQMGSNTSAPCCVPNKLSPITLMYAYDKAIVLLSRYENMVVESCACLWNELNTQLKLNSIDVPRIHNLLGDIFVSIL